ncbi:MAG: oligosaccharide flippase family protein, partial [Candidatus Hodarchaeota archaeon]
MLGRIKKILNDKTNKKLISNFLSLGILEGANYIIPLITLPYLLRVLATDDYGIISFAQKFIQYFVLVTAFGFGISATKRISENRLEKEKLSEIFTSVLVIKFFLMCLSISIIFLLIFNINFFHQDQGIYLITFGSVVANVIFTPWFFQGLERMKYITILNLVGRILYAISIFMFINNEEDYILVPVFNSMSLILTGALGIFIVFKKFGVKLVFNKQSIILLFKESIFFFISRIS